MASSGKKRSTQKIKSLKQTDVEAKKAKSVKGGVPPGPNSQKYIPPGPNV